MIPAPATRRERRRGCSTLLLSILVSLLLTAPALGEAEEPSSAPAGAEAAPADPGDAGPGDADPEGGDQPQGDMPPLPVLVVDEVTITATRSERSVLEAPGNVTVIDRKTIERSGVRNVPELLRRNTQGGRHQVVADHRPAWKVRQTHREDQVVERQRTSLLTVQPVDGAHHTAGDIAAV